MALKDNWIDRQNGIDDVDSEDINKVARAVIEAEKRLDDVGIGATFFPYVSESGIISWTNDGGLPNPTPINIKGEDANAQEIISYSNETFANALKGSKIGGIVSISDISPIQHILGVRVRSEDLNSPIPEISAVKVKKLGKNLFNNDTSTMDAVTYVNARGESNTDFGYELHLPAGKYTVSAKFVDNPIFESVYIYTYINNKNGEFVPFSEAFKNVDGSNKIDQYIITETAVHKPFIYNVKEGDVIYIIDAVPKNINDSKKRFDSIQIQIEQGTIVTEYEPYIEPTEYAVNADGAVDGVTSLYPNTTLMTDTDGVIIDCEYNRDINKAFAALEAAIATNNI